MTASSSCLKRQKLADKKRLDFDLHQDDIPEDWDKLREEARNAIENGIEVASMKKFESSPWFYLKSQ